MRYQMTNDKTISGLRRDDRMVPAVEDMDRVRAMLISKPRDLLLFDLLTQTGARLTDTLKLKLKDIAGLKAGASLPLPINGPDTASAPVLTKGVVETLSRLLEQTHLNPEDYLFRSRKGPLPLSLSSGSHLIRKWFRDAGIRGLAGARTLHKYWEMHIKAGSNDRKKVDDDLIFPAQDSTRILKPIEASTLQETVYQQLFEAIVSGHIPPGSRIVIGKIAKQMKVSPMPVREALHRLQAMGYLSRTKKRANIVNRLSTDNLREITSIRMILEPMAGKYAALHRSNETVDYLQKLHQNYIRVIQKRDSDKILQLNKEFHHTIYRAARMPILFEIIEILYARASPYIYILMRESAPTDVAWSIATHAEIIDALRDRDSERIAQVLETDLSRAAHDLMSMLGELWGGSNS